MTAHLGRSFSFNDRVLKLMEIDMTVIVTECERTPLVEAERMMGTQIAGVEYAPERAVGFAPDALTRMRSAGFMLVYLGNESILDLLQLGCLSGSSLASLSDFGFMKSREEAGWHLIRFGSWRIAPGIQPSLRVLEAQRIVHAYRVLKSSRHDFSLHKTVVSDSRILHASHLPGSMFPVVMLRFESNRLDIETRQESEIAVNESALWGFREMYRAP